MPQPTAFKTLKDIPVNDRDFLVRLAALAPKEKTAPPTKGRQKSPGRSGRRDLGEFDVEAYLRDHGIDFNVKSRGGRTLYRLTHCLFDPSHGKNDAYIQKTPGAPLIYHCSHQSCNHTWAQARERISGGAKLLKYMSGYDPDYHPGPKERGTGMLLDMSIGTETFLPDAPPAVPPPKEIDPMEFFIVTEKGRSMFIPERMAKYYVQYYQHLVHTAGVFWIFKNGMWQEISEYVLQQICVQAMKEYIQPAMIEGSIKILRGMVNKEPDEWPDCRDYINCINGMINIESKEIEPHEPSKGLRAQIPCKYDWSADWTPWLDTLEGIFPGENEKIDLLQEFFGYCLWFSCKYEKALFLIGPGGNGKGVILSMLIEMLGAKNVSTLTMQHLSEKKFSLYYVENKFANIAAEVSHRDPIATENLKTLISGEWVTDERKHGAKYQFRPFAKYVFALNDMPVIPDRSYGLERRLLILRCGQTFDDEKKDTGLKDRLVECRDGVFMWALMGLDRILKNDGFSEEGKVKADKESFMRDLHPFLQFCQEVLVVGEKKCVEKMTLYEKYKDWCKDGNYRALNKKRFSDQVLMHYPDVDEKPYTDNRRLHFVGIDVKLEI